MPIPAITIRRQNGRDTSNPFDRHPDNRPLRILVDQQFEREPLDDSSPAAEPDQTVDPDCMLRGLLQHSGLDVTWVSNTLEAGTVRIWKAEPTDEVLAFDVGGKGSWSRMGVWQYDKWFNRTRAYGAEADSALEDFMLAMIAVELEADVLVTKRPRLLDTKKSLVADANALAPADALAIIGLFLRCRDDYIIVGPNRYRTGKRIVYLSTSYDLLPEGSRQVSACGEHSRRNNDDTAMLLAHSGQQRIARALMARDELHRLLFLPQNNSIQDDVLAQLDWFLVSLMGAFDVAARIAHVVCGLDPAKRRQAGWQREGWTKKLAAHSPELAAAVVSGTEVRDALDLCIPLRNSVHGETLQGIGYRESSQPQKTLVQIPPDDLADLLAIVERRGGETQWGIKQLASDCYINAAVFVDTLLPFVCRALTELMRLTPVERLDGGQAVIKSALQGHRWFGEGMHSRLRLLMGTA